MDKKIINRDLLWIIGILVGLLILVISIRLSDDKDIINIFSLMSSGVSIALALIAIAISIKQDYGSEIINQKTIQMLDTIDGKVNKLDYMISNIDMEKILEFERETSTNYDEIAKKIDLLAMNEGGNNPDIQKQLKDLSQDVSLKKKDFFNDLGLTLIDALNNLSELEQSVLITRFGLEDGKAKSLAETGQKLGMTMASIKRTEEIALNKLRKMGISDKFILDIENRNININQ